MKTKTHNLISVEYAIQHQISLVSRLSELPYLTKNVCLQILLFFYTHYLSSD